MLSYLFNNSNLLKASPKQLLAFNKEGKINRPNPEFGIYILLKIRDPDIK